MIASEVAVRSRIEIETKPELGRTRRYLQHSIADPTAAVGSVRATRRHRLRGEMPYFLKVTEPQRRDRVDDDSFAMRDIRRQRSAEKKVNQRPRMVIRPNLRQSTRSRSICIAEGRAPALNRRAVMARDELMRR